MVYDKSIVDMLRNALSTGLSSLENMDYPESFKINIASICIELVYDERLGRKAAQMVIQDMSIDNQYLAVWRTYAPGHFMPKDWRKETRDKEGKSPYYVVRFKHGKHNMKALLRRLIELDDNNITERERHELLKEYDDLQVGTHHYAIIKICNTELSGEAWLTPKRVCKDIMHAHYIDTVDGSGNVYKNDYSDVDEPENTPEENPMADEEEEPVIESNTLL